MYNLKLSKEQEKNMLEVYNSYDDWYRSMRGSILQAFDIYKTNVMYGIEEESEKEKRDILDWYKKVLKLEKDAIENVPDKIKRYL